jgi:hypothetical protein
MLDETASTVVDVNRRVAIGHSGVRQVARCLMCHELTLCQRNALVQMHVIAATIYGCETWQLTEAMRSRIATVQTTALRLTTHSPLTCTTRPTTTTEQLAGIEMIDDDAPIFELAAALAEKEVKEYRHRPNAELFRVTGAKPVLDQIRERTARFAMDVLQRPPKLPERAAAMVRPARTATTLYDYYCSLRHGASHRQPAAPPPQPKVPYRTLFEFSFAQLKAPANAPVTF